MEKENLQKKISTVCVILKVFQLQGRGHHSNFSSPYYAACPNPFIEDFIREYGTPYDEETDDYHRETFSADISEGKTDAMYNLHNIILSSQQFSIYSALHKTRRYRFRCLCGNWNDWCSLLLGLGRFSILQAELCNAKEVEWGRRYSILNDLSPAATYIAGVYNLNRQVDVEDEGARILDELDSQFGWAYRTKHSIQGKNQFGIDGKPIMGIINYVVWSDVVVCPSCGKESVFAEIGMDKETGIRNSKNLVCPYCGTEDNASAY